MASVVSGELLSDDLKPIGPVHVTTHDFYLYPGELTVNPANGDYLLLQLGQSHEQTVPHPVWMTRIASNGTVQGSTSWPASTPGQTAQRQVHASYEPEGRDYVVAWLLTGAGSASFDARTASADLRRLGRIDTIPPGNATLGSDFSVAGIPGTATAVVAWLNQRQTSPPVIVAQRLGSNGQPLGMMSAISVLRDPPPPGDAGLGRLQLTAASGRNVASLQGIDQSEIVAIPPGLNGAGNTSIAGLPGAISTYSHATIANPSADTLAILSSSDTRAADQIYARVVPLPR